MKKSKNAGCSPLLSAASLLTGILIVPGFIAGNALYNMALNRHKERGDLSMLTGPQAEGAAEQNGAGAQSWFAGRTDVEKVSVTSEDGLKLYAFAAENPDAPGRWVIMPHGYGSSHDMYTGHSENFFRLGFSILAPDMRGHGESEGDYIGMGWHDRRDMLLWIDLILKRHPDAQILLYGISMGGATVMMTSGEDLPPQVKAAVEDCGYTSVAEEFAHTLRAAFHVMPFPVLHYAGLVTKIRAGYGFWEASSVRQLKKKRIPMLFIHGSEDNLVPFRMLGEVYDAAPEPKERLVVQGAGHGNSSQIGHDLYWSTVEAFVKKYFS